MVRLAVVNEASEPDRAEAGNMQILTHFMLETL